MNSGALKEWIASTAGSSPSILGELEAHDIDSWGKSRWRRVRKKRVRTGEAGLYEWMYRDTLENAQKPAIPLGELAGCTFREFLHVDGDALFAILTDVDDSEIIGWAFQSD
jgi:hypothetical protein